MSKRICKKEGCKNTLPPKNKKFCSKECFRSSDNDQGGQPPLFKTKKELRDRLFEYLEECKKERVMPNIAGLCVFLDISRQSYYEYAKKDEFSDTIKRFEAAVESVWVNRLSGSAATGAIFYLKNAFREEYRDRHEHAVDTNLNISFDESFKKDATS